VQISIEYSKKGFSTHCKTGQVGAACVAQFSLDEAWYRSEIIGTKMTSCTGDDDDLQCTIQFVDFGNKEDCSFKKLKRVKSVYAGLPALSMQIGLHGVKTKVRIFRLLHVCFNSIVYVKCFVLQQLDKFVELVPPMEKDFAFELVEQDGETSGSTPLVRLWVPGEAATLNEQLKEALAGDEEPDIATTDSAIAEKIEEPATEQEAPSSNESFSSSFDVKIVGFQNETNVF